MNFTADHESVLAEHQHHWAGLRDIGVMQNLEEKVVKSLQLVYNEAIGPTQFTPWCKECVCDLVRLLYTNYDAWKNHQPQEEAANNPTDTKNTGGKGGRKSKNQNATDGN